MKPYLTLFAGLLVCFAMFCFWTGQSLIPAVGFSLIAIWLQLVAVTIAVDESNRGPG